MKSQNILIPVVLLAVLAAAWQNHRWQGIALVVTVLVMWGMLNVTRMMQVMKRAAERPVGHVASAVMLNAKLKPGVNLLHVIALTRALGALQSPKDAQPEVYRWTDTGGSFVDVTLVNGKVTQWQLTRPTEPDDAGAAMPAP